MKKTIQKSNIIRNEIPIFFAVDDNYVPFLCVALQSLTDNCSERYDYRIHVLIEELSEESRRAIFSFRRKNVDIEFIDVREKIRSLCAKLHLRDYYTKATYYRFFIPELFPQYDRGLYLDCDIVINCDIARLYNCPMGQNLVAGIPEEVMTDIDVFGRYSEIVLGIDRNDYINAGIIVMNLKKMRKIGIEQQFADLLGVRACKVAQDQDYLNLICQGEIFYLNKKWNKTPMPDSNTSIMPNIVHYKINFKPWRYDNIPYGEYFWTYAEKTEFYSMLREMKKNYSPAEMARDAMQYNNLVALAEAEISNEEAKRSHSFSSFCAEVV